MAKQVKLEIRKEIWERDNYQCTYCEKDIDKKRGSHLTVDHVVPRTQGGANHISNLVTCCSECNKKKGHLLLDQFIRAFELTITPAMERLL